MITHLAFTLALAGNFEAKYDRDEFTEKSYVSLCLDAENVKTGKSTLQHVALMISTLLDPQGDFTGLFIFHNGPFLFAQADDVYFIIDDARFHLECEGGVSGGYTTSCTGSKINKVLTALRHAKTSVRIRTELAQFVIPIVYLQEGFRKYDSIYAEHRSR